jgi:hypothetical protein
MRDPAPRDPSGFPGGLQALLVSGESPIKKRWGGRLETFYNLDVVLSSISSYLQERVLSPVWDRVHHLYVLMDAVRSA